MKIEQNYADLVDILYMNFRNSSKGDIAGILEECELLEIQVEEEVLFSLQAICLEEPEIERAREKAKEIDDASLAKITEEIEREKSELEAKALLKERQAEEAAAEKKREKKELQKLKGQLLEMAKAVNYHEHISDYEILSAKHQFEIQKMVQKGIKNGWKPFGNMSVYHPGGNPIGPAPDYFFQAMVKFKYKT